MKSLIFVALFVAFGVLLACGVFDSKDEESDVVVEPDAEIEPDAVSDLETEESSIDIVEATEEKPVSQNVGYSAKVLCIIGNELIDKFQYGSNGALYGVMTDLRNVHNFYRELGGWRNIYGEPIDNFERDVIHETKATAESMFDSVDKAAKYLSAFEGQKLFKIYSSGHGAQRWKMGDDGDNYAETYVMYNKMVFDDDFNAYLNAKFDKSQDVLIETDRCYAGGLARAGISRGVAKFMQTEDVAHMECYSRKTKSVPRSKPRIKYLCSSREDETSGDLGEGFGGEYTLKGYAIRRENKNISYADYIAKVREVVKGQTPKLLNAFGIKTTWKDTFNIE